MAMTGLAYPVVADCSENSSGTPNYSNSVVIGRACRFRLEPHYDEDASEYTDLNDLDPRHEFSYADFALTLAEAGDDALAALGHDVSGGNVSFSDLDLSGPKGLALIETGRIGGTKYYFVTFLAKVVFRDGDTDVKTRGKTIDYSTQEIKGIAYPSGNGMWRLRRSYTNKEKALEAIEELVGA